MPATKLVCPHCEKTVEIQVSSVTRSRPCPECGEMVMLQMAEKSTRTKRRALLMGKADESDPVAAAAPAPPEKVDHSPQPLAGDAFERMRMDPEVRQFRRKLVIGASIAVGLLLALILVGLFAPAPDPAPKSETGAASEQEEVASPTAALQDLPSPVTSGNLVFRPAGGSMTTAAPSAAPPTESLKRLAAGEEVLRKFLEAPDRAKRSAFVRHPSKTASLMETYYSKNADGPIIYDSIVESAEGMPGFTEHVVVFEGGGRRSANVEHSSGGPKVDWEAFVGAGEQAWSDFLDARPTTPILFRVLVSPAGHYANDFGSPQNLKCYSLQSITEPGAKVVYGYLERGSAQSKGMDYWLEQNMDEAVPMIVKLKFPAAAPVDFQVWITEFVQVGWAQK